MCLKNRKYICCIALLTILLLVVIGGCAPVGPDYKKPDISVGDKWYSELNRGLTSTEDPNILSQWWKTLDDPMLTALIDRAVSSNLDMKIARSRVRQARANRGKVQASLFPTLNFSGSDTWSRSGVEGGTGETTQLYSAGFDAGWEIDVFGGVRRSLESSESSLQADQEGLYDTLVSLIAEVALNYIDVRTYQYRIEKVEENLQAQAETYQLVQWQSQADLIDDLAVQQALYNLESTRSQLPSLNTSLQQAMNSIAVLLGEKPGDINEKLKISRPLPSIPAAIAVGIPADVIRRRPDIRKAEHQLASQTAQVGVATADLYPKFTLSGSISGSGASINRLGNRMSAVNDWNTSYGPGIRWPIFDAGKIRQNIIVQNELQEQALLNYESVILSAVEEVENALTAYVNEYTRTNNLEKAVEAAKSAVDLSEQEYQSGLVDFSNVLDAQRSLLSFENQLAESEGTAASNLIRLYKALGGGWSSYVSEENNHINNRGDKSWTTQIK